MAKYDCNYVLLDCDGGSDDAWALLSLLKLSDSSQCDYPKIKLLGITVSGCGNVDKYNAARNMLRILRLCKREEVPIYFGANESLLPASVKNSNINLFHGFDGFGDVLKQDISNEEIDNIIDKKHAVNAIYEFCHTYYQQVTFIGVGPLTNLALCYSMFETRFAESVAHIYIMGGNYQGVGNITRAAEFNFHSDPEAAQIVLAKAKCPITIVPWELFLEDRFCVSIDWRFKELIGKLNPSNAVMALFNKVEHAQWSKQSSQIWNPCDVLAPIIWAFGENIITKQSKWHAVVDLNGSYTRGQMVLDHLHENPKNVMVIENLNIELFKNIVNWLADVDELKVAFSKNFK